MNFVNKKNILKYKNINYKNILYLLFSLYIKLKLKK